MKSMIELTAKCAAVAAAGGLMIASPGKVDLIPQARAQAATSICKSYVSNGVGVYNLVAKYARLLNVDLASTFSTIDEVYGTVAVTPTPWMPGRTITIPQNPAAGLWRPGGYAGWQTFHNTPTSTGLTDMVDIRFGQSAGIYPGQTAVPAGVLHLYAVSRKNGTDTSNFNLTICGKPKSTLTCHVLHVDQANRHTLASRIPPNFPGGPAKLVSVKSTNVTVHAFGSIPAETKPIFNPTTIGQPRAGPFKIALNNRQVLFFSTPKGYVITHPIDTWRAQAGQPYLTIGSPVRPGEWVSPVNSWAGPPGAVDNPAHGNITADVEICVQ